MVADSLQVRTYRDPDCAPPMAQADSQLPGADAHRARRLQLTIPAVDRQFIVKDGSSDFEVGTEVSLLALNRKIKSEAAPEVSNSDSDELDGAEEPGSFQRGLKVTEYLCETAGFVEFPIHVEERWPGQPSPLLTLILHPDRNPEDERRDFDPKIVVHQLSRNYPWEMVTAPESLDLARDLMTDYRFELKELLGDEGYEGWVNFPAPKEGDFWDGGNYASGNDQQGASTVIAIMVDGDFCEKRIFWSPIVYEEPRPSTNLFSVYRDGILLKGITEARRLLDAEFRADAYGNQALPVLQVQVNFAASGSPRPNVSRTTFVNADDVWDTPIWDAILTRLATTEIPRSLALSPAERLVHLGWLMAVFPLTLREMKEMVPAEKRVHVWLVPPGYLDLREGRCCAVSVPVVPRFLTDTIMWLATEQFAEGKSDSKLEWQEPASVFANFAISYGYSGSVPVANGLACAAGWTTVAPEQLQFLLPPQSIGQLITEVTGSVSDTLEAESEFRWRSSRERSGVEERKRRVRASFKAVTTGAMPLSQSQVRDVVNFIRPTPIAFSAPFEHCYRTLNQYGRPQHLNIRSDLGLAVFRCLAACEVAIQDQRLLPSAVVEFEHCRYIHDFHEFAERLFDIVETNMLIEGLEPPPIPDEITDVPTLRDMEFKPMWDWDIEDWTSVGPFGHLITEWPLPDQEDAGIGSAQAGPGDSRSDA